MLYPFIFLELRDSLRPDIKPYSRPVEFNWSENGDPIKDSFPSVLIGLVFTGQPTDWLHGYVKSDLKFSVKLSKICPDFKSNYTTRKEELKCYISISHYDIILWLKYCILNYDMITFIIQGKNWYEVIE